MNVFRRVKKIATDSKAIAKGVLLMGGGLVFASCAPSSENEEKALAQAQQQLKELPELKEEIEEEKAKTNAQTIEGSFTGICDGETFEFNNWNARYSRISFLDFSANFYACIQHDPHEEMSIKLVAENWHKKQLPYAIPASLYVMDGTEYLQVTYTRKSHGGDVLQTFQTAEGNMMVEAINEEAVRITFDGEGFVGDIRLQERAPLSFQIDLAYNFVTDDRRTK